MSTSSKTAVVGRRLRRTLGALLAAGFGVTWWGLVPPARAEAPKLGPSSNPNAHAIAKRAEVEHAPTRRLVTLAVAKLAPKRPVARVKPPVIDVQPVVERSPFAQPPPGWTGRPGAPDATPVHAPVAHPPVKHPPRVRPVPPKPPPTPTLDPLPDLLPVTTPVEPPFVDAVPVPQPEPVPVVHTPIPDDYIKLPPTRSS